MIDFDELDGLTPEERVEVMCKVAQDDLLTYSMLMDKNYEPGTVHYALCDKLEQVERGEVKRLIITMPPRHGKSRLVATEFATWVMGRDPTNEVIVTSYGRDIAQKRGGEARERVAGEKYAQVFPKVRLKRGSAARSNWEVTGGGTYLSTPLGGGLTGLGADLLVIDDPHKNRLEAESVRMRERVWDFWASTAYTRLSPRGRVVVIMTRWHEDDLVGRLLDPKYTEGLKELEDEDDQWEIFELPALAHDNDQLDRKPGMALWPERFPENRLKAIRAVVGSYEWSALYDCNPVLRGGNVAVVDNLIYVDDWEVPEDVGLYRAWDIAVSTKQTADYSAGAYGGFYQVPMTDEQEKLAQKGQYEPTPEQKGLFYIVDIWAGRRRWPELKKKIIHYARREQNVIGIEAVGGFQTAYEEIAESLRGTNLVQSHVPTEDKLIRANPWLAALEDGRVFLVRGEWNMAFVNELTSFPDGKHDDQVDAVSLLWKMTAKSDNFLYA